MTHVVKLFGDITAEQTEKGTFVVRKDGKVVSPYEYAEGWMLTPKVCALRKTDEEGEQSVDILFSNGRWFFGAIYAHELAMRGSKEGKYQHVNLWGFEPSKKRYLIAVIVNDGTHILSEEGDYLTFMPHFPRITVLDGMFLIGHHSKGPIPHVSVYDLHGHFICSGEVWKAIFKAREKVRGEKA